MLRLQASTDILRHLKKLALLDDDAFDAFHLLSSRLQNDGILQSFDMLRGALVGHGIAADRLDREIRTALAASSTISYIHMGRPETILINSEEGIAKWSEQARSTTLPRNLSTTLE